MKDFLLIANKNCVTYKEVFPMFKQGMVSFGSPVKQYEGTDKKFGNHGWITTFPVANKKKLVLTATYDPAYPTIMKGLWAFLSPSLTNITLNSSRLSAEVCLTI